MFNINTLLDKILFELKIFNPIYCRVFDDPRIDTYFISVNQNNYIVLYGGCDECEQIVMYNNNNMKHNLMTTKGLEIFANEDTKEDEDEAIFDFELDTFDGNEEDLIKKIQQSVMSHLSSSKPIMK